MYSDGPLGASFVMLCFHRCFSAAFTYTTAHLFYIGTYYLSAYVLFIERTQTYLNMYLIFTSED